MTYSEREREAKKADRQSATRAKPTLDVTLPDCMAGLFN